MIVPAAFLLLGGLIGLLVGGMLRQSKIQDAYWNGYFEHARTVKFKQVGDRAVPIYDWQDRLATNWARHLADDCSVKKAGKDPYASLDKPYTYGRCCDEARELNGCCVCKHILCCPEHGHTHVGTHD